MTAHRRVLVTCVAIAAAGAPAATADGAGFPIPSARTSRIGAVAPGGSERLTTRRAGGDTVVSAVRRGRGRVLRSRRISGRWLVPAVTLDGGTTGLSADGGTLVLVHRTRSFPSARTRLAVLDARRLTVRRRISLAGFFTVDAISPDGGRAYLVQYAADNNFLDYRVRALDTGSGRLVAGNVVDPRKPGEQMGGFPYTRVVSADGRWAYTLYGGGSETFIHALDTVGGTAACIDLDMLSPGGDFSGAQLRLTGGRLLVADHRQRVAIVDTKTFAVREPGAAVAAPAPVASARPAAPARAPAPRHDDGFPWLVVLIVGGAGALGAAAVVLVRRSGPGDEVVITTRVP
jgi:DNA-binding beta-propeller fold protein YncE